MKKLSYIIKVKRASKDMFEEKLRVDPSSSNIALVYVYKVEKATLFSVRFIVLIFETGNNLTKRTSIMSSLPI